MFVCFTFQPPCSIWVSWARDQTRAAAATFAAMLAPLTRCAGAEDETYNRLRSCAADSVGPQWELCVKHIYEQNQPRWEGAPRVINSNEVM